MRYAATLTGMRVAQCRQPLKPKLRGASLSRSHTLSRELDIKLQGSGDLTRTGGGHKRSCSTDERKKKDRASTVDPSSTSSLMSDLKEKEVHRKKEKKRGESFNNRAFTLRPPTSSSAASALSPRDKAHKRTRSSADDLGKVAGVRDRVKESLRTPPFYYFYYYIFIFIFIILYKKVYSSFGLFYLN